MTQISIHLWGGFFVEFLLSFFLIISVATDSRAVGEMAGIAIGGDYTLIWIFVITIILGAIVGAHFYEWIKYNKKK